MPASKSNSDSCHVYCVMDSDIPRILNIYPHASKIKPLKINPENQTPRSVFEMLWSNFHAKKEAS